MRIANDFDCHQTLPFTGRCQFKAEVVEQWTLMHGEDELSAFLSHDCPQNVSKPYYVPGVHALYRVVQNEHRVDRDSIKFSASNRLRAAVLRLPKLKIAPGLLKSGILDFCLELHLELPRNGLRSPSRSSNGGGPRKVDHGFR